jgi:hypothetical protein
VHPGRSAFNHLSALALTHGIPRRRVEEVIEIAGLWQVARKQVGVLVPTTFDLNEYVYAALRAGAGG